MNTLTHTQKLIYLVNLIEGIYSKRQTYVRREQRKMYATKAQQNGKSVKNHNITYFVEQQNRRQLTNSFEKGGEKIGNVSVHLCAEMQVPIVQYTLH